MARKNRTPEEKERRAKIRELLVSSNVTSMGDIQNLFKDTIAEFMENGLEAELDDELGYTTKTRTRTTATTATAARRCALASAMWTSLCPEIAKANLSRRCCGKTRQASAMTSRKKYCRCMPRA